jgi:chromosome segregation ATPase
LATLIKVLAASLGGGLVFGAGIRLGDALARRESGSRKSYRGSGGLEARMEKQAADISAMRLQLAVESRQIEALSDLSSHLKRDLPDWIEKSVAERIEQAEADLKAESERNRKETLEIFVEEVQTRVAHRISWLEEEVSLHSAAVTELRACSLRTEASIEKLAGSIDRLLSARQAIPVVRATPPAAPETPQVKEAVAGAGGSPSRPRRWGIFS